MIIENYHPIRGVSAMRILTLAVFILWFIGADRVTRLSAHQLDPKMKVSWDASSDFGGFVILIWALSAIFTLIISNIAWADIHGIDDNIPSLMFIALVGNVTIWTVVLWLSRGQLFRCDNAFLPLLIKSLGRNATIAILIFAASVLGIMGFILVG